MTPKERVLAVLNGEMPDKVPFTMYEGKIRDLPYTQRMFDRGLCMVQRVYSSFRVCPTNITGRAIPFEENGRKMIRNIVSTPAGDMESITEPVGFTSWTHTRFFKSEEDYPKLEAYLSDYIIEPADDVVAAALKQFGDHPNVILRDNLPLEPLQDLIGVMGMENFCYEWMDNRDEILKLYNILMERNRKIYPIVANSPFRFSNYGGNVTPAVIGRDGFKDYYMPAYAEAHEYFKKAGKLMGTHLDGENAPIMDLIAQADLDYIEAYDPGCSPSVQEAMACFKDKILWINWPSAWQLGSAEEVKENTLKMIREADLSRFIIGITEDVPPTVQERNLDAILDAIDEYGPL